MKHLFYIHSYITYIVSISTVHKLCLPLKDIVFLYGRGFNYRHTDNKITTTHIPSHLYNAISGIPAYGKPFILLRSCRELCEFDKLLNSITEKEAYFCYLPLTKSYLTSLIATHTKCREIAFIEEGLLTYTGKFKKRTNQFYNSTLRGRLIRALKYLNHGNRSLYYSPYTSMASKLFTISSEIHLSDFDITVLDSLVVPKVPQQYISNNSHLLIVDTVVNHGITSIENYLETLQVFADYCHANNIRKIWIRFRPDTEPADYILRFFAKEDIGLHIIPDEVCIESILYKSENLTVVGLHSSLLFYAAIWGHKSYSLLDKLIEIDPKAKQQYQKILSLPKIFHQKVEQL